MNNAIFIENKKAASGGWMSCCCRLLCLLPICLVHF